MERTLGGAMSKHSALRRPDHESVGFLAGELRQRVWSSARCLQRDVESADYNLTARAIELSREITLLKSEALRTIYMPTVAELGFKSPATLGEITQRGRELRLAECPQQYGLEVCLTKMILSVPFHNLIVSMWPVSIDGRRNSVFVIHNHVREVDTVAASDPVQLTTHCLFCGPYR